MRPLVSIFNLALSCIFNSASTKHFPASILKFNSAHEVCMGYRLRALHSLWHICEPVNYFEHVHVGFIHIWCDTILIWGTCTSWTGQNMKTFNLGQHWHVHVVTFVFFLRADIITGVCIFVIPRKLFCIFTERSHNMHSTHENLTKWSVSFNSQSEVEARLKTNYWTTICAIWQGFVCTLWSRAVSRLMEMVMEAH